MRKLETLFKDFINAPIQIYSGATFKKGLYSLLDVYDNTVSGDLVMLKGNHDIGNNSIQLKDGVNWQFLGNPTISSVSTSGTFYDNNVASVVNFEGKPILRNNGCVHNTFVLSNDLSFVHGFSFVFDIRVYVEEDFFIGIRILENNIIDDLSQLVLVPATDLANCKIKFPYQSTPIKQLREIPEYSVLQDDDGYFTLGKDINYGGVPTLYDYIQFNFKISNASPYLSGVGQFHSRTEWVIKNYQVMDVEFNA